MQSKSPSKSILVVDDDDDSRESVAGIIRSEGFKVEAARSGREALDKLRWGLRPSLIFLHLQMAVMTGWDFRNEQKQDPDLAPIPVVAMSDDRWKDKDLKEFAACIPNPVDLEVLQRKLKLFCG
jgi:CheY-like chemotaxis protein